MATLNLGILAHVDAGKTSLTERLLYAAGVLDRIGSVDRGSTRTDTLALERARGITIKAAVVSFPLGDRTVNLIDTPGHPDFIAEVERVLDVLDGAVLVLSAVEGVQAQTRILLRTLRRLRIPTLLLVNKVDRADAREASLLADIRTLLCPEIVALGTVATGLGTRSATVRPLGAGDPGHVEALTELVAGDDEELLARYLDGRPIAYAELRRRLADRTRQATAYPVLFGSAITGAGTDLLTELLPTAGGDPDGPPAGRVFKIDRGPGGHQQAYARLFSGTLRTRDRVTFGRGSTAKVTGIRVFAHGTDQPDDAVRAGQIALLSGLAEVRIGDVLGDSAPAQPTGIAPPSLETVVTAADPAQRGTLHAALTLLAEQDPLIDLRTDPDSGEVTVSLYGEVQKEVIAATLADDFGVAARFTATTVRRIERPTGVGTAVRIGDTVENPLLASLGLRVEPGPVGTGITYAVAGDRRRTLPPAFFTAVAETVPAALQRGRLGWPVTDCRVTLTDTGYWPRQSHAHAAFDKSMSSTAGDFRALTPTVLRAALAEAGTAVLEPVHRFRLELPADQLGPVLPMLARLGAVPHAQRVAGALAVVEGEVPAARIQLVLTRLPGLTRGEGVLETGFDHYEPVRGEPPRRG